MSRRGRRGRRGPRGRQRILALGFGCVAAALLVITGEVGFRAAGVQPAYQADLLGGWRMLPQQQEHTVRGREGVRFTLSTNADGMRTEIPQERTQPVWRVALTGDSTTFGWGADNGETVADGLAAALAQGHTELGPVEVINAGQPGYSTVQAARFFDEIVHRYRPDLVVHFLAMHDHNQVLVSDLEHLRGASGPGSLVRVGLARHSRLYQVMRQALVPLNNEAFLMPQQSSGEVRVARVSDAERGQVLDEMRAKLDTWGGALALGHLPFLGDLEQGSPTDRVGEAWAAAYAAEHGLAMVDLRACCGPDAGDLVLPKDPGHLSGPGNLAAGRFGAAQLAAALKEMGAGTGAAPPGYGSSL